MASLSTYVRRHHVALLALFVALGGTSYAAVSLPRGSVGKRELKTNAVTSAKVKNHSLRAQDFKAGQIPQGPPGLPGAPGTPGKDGTDGKDAAPASTWLGGGFDPFEGAVSGPRPPFGPAGAVFYALAPAGTPIALSHLSAHVDVAPEAGHSRKITLGIFPSFDTTLDCVIADGATSCDTGGATLPVPAGARWGLFASDASPAAASDLSYSYLATPR